MAEVSNHNFGYNNNNLQANSPENLISPKHSYHQQKHHSFGNKGKGKENQQNQQSNINNCKNKFVSHLVLWQTNPKKANYTIYVKMVINPKKRPSQEIRFPFKPDKESLESVIDEMIDALKLNKNYHKKIIIESIKNKMKSKRMKIVKTSPINSQKNIQKPNQKPPSLQSSEDPQDTDIDEFIFSPLSPLPMVSPHTIHRKSNATFPNLRLAKSVSFSESDPLSLMNKVRETYSNKSSQCNSRESSKHNLSEHEIDELYVDKLLID